ncbi:YfbM family protein [Streptomyces sp. DSM 41972]|uniref:YfbM family protein n=1 Tax=Streptomyces althioticus subsp. attaecolombicae TaxID=3075534 RepID=A0ABU3HTD1_9ACTN|nr:YfbM family protein [Streptomyces sp. DSM 41972]
MTAAEFERAVGDPGRAYERVQELTGQEWDVDLPGDRARRFETDKMWHALDFLLRRVGFPVDVVFGEERIPGADDWSYGPPRCLTPEQVRTAAEAFSATPPARLTEGVTPADPAAAEICPTIVRERGEPLDEVTAHYEALVPYFRGAARDGDGVLLRIS